MLNCFQQNHCLSTGPSLPVIDRFCYFPPTFLTAIVAPTRRLCPLVDRPNPLPLPLSSSLLHLVACPSPCSNAPRPLEATIPHRIQKLYRIPDTRSVGPSKSRTIQFSAWHPRLCSTRVARRPRLPVFLPRQRLSQPWFRLPPRRLPPV